MRLLILTACLILIPLILALPLRAEDDLLLKSQSLFKPAPESPPELENNPITTEKVELGKMLYFEPGLSASNLISCNTCHNLGTGGVDLQETSIGHAWQKGPRNAPTVLNSVFNVAHSSGTAGLKTLPSKPRVRCRHP
jgi:cytochrome c peroxidase